MSEAIYRIMCQYPRHYFGSDGSIIGPRQRPLAWIDNGNGYYYVNLHVGNQQIHAYVHALICTAFHGPCPDGLEAAHLDGIRLNCAASNLIWKTHLDNIRDKQRHGTQTRGENHHSALLIQQDVDEIRLTYARGAVSMAHIATQYGVSSSCVQKIVDMRTYQRAGQVIDPQEKLSRGKGERHSKAKLSTQDILDIRTSYASGLVTHRQLALKYGISAPSVTNIINRKTWTHVL